MMEQSNNGVKMRYAQIRLTEEEFIEVKKTILNEGVSLENFIKEAIKEKILSIKALSTATKNISS
jgi:predicted DNA binding CopG/RHH family protein